MPADTEITQSLVNLYEGTSMERNFVVTEKRRISSSFSSSSLSSLALKSEDAEEENPGRRLLALPTILELSTNGSMHDEKVSHN